MLMYVFSGRNNPVDSAENPDILELIPYRIIYTLPSIKSIILDTKNCFFFTIIHFFKLFFEFDKFEYALNTTNSAQVQ